MPSSEGQSGNHARGEVRDPSSLVGIEIGDFEIIREIGRGGMGTVFQARQKSLNRIVALKVLSSGLGLTPTSVLRFQREAQAAASLHHQNIVQIHAQGESNGVYYYAMELVRGENLHDLIVRGRIAQGTPMPAPALATSDDPEATAPLPAMPGIKPAIPELTPHPGASRSSSAATHKFEQIARLIAAAADALDYAHRQGVIHRDIKPHNLILSENGCIFISDFGLARVLEQPGVTTTGEFVGSPLYMSPEQIIGGREKVDKRTDVYSLGATLYEWLTLSPPYPGENREQVISKVIASEPPAPCSLNPQIPVDLDTICLKALDKDPDRRYASAGEMCDDLQRFLAHEPIRAKRAGFIARVYKAVLRNKVASVATFALLVASVLTLALVSQYREQAGQKQEIAAITETTEELQQTVKETKEEAAVTATANEMARALLSGEQLGQQVKEIPGAAQLLDVLSVGPEADPLAERVAEAFIGLRRSQEAQRLPGHLGPSQGAVHELYLQALATQDRAAVESLVAECLRRQPDHPGVVMLAAALACARHDYADMAIHAARAIELAPDAPDGLLLRGTAALLSGDLASATGDFNAAVRMGRQTEWSITLRGVAHQRQGDLTLAMHDFDDVLAASSDNTLALFERARGHAALDDYEAAIADATRAIECEGERAKAYHYVFRGDCYDALGRYRKSASDFEHAIGLEPLSARIGTRLWQAVAKQKQQEAAAATTQTPPKATRPVSPTDNPAPPAGSGANVGWNPIGGLHGLWKHERMTRLPRLVAGFEATGWRPGSARTTQRSPNDQPR